MEMAWTEQLSVGNEAIDSEHKKLIRLTNDVIRAIQARESSGLARAFEQLEHWLCLHFANEQKMAQAIGFDFSNHQLAHHYGLNELRFLRGLLIAKNCLWFDGAMEHFTHFLKRWMIDDHIVRMDMRMKPVLQARPYGFKFEEANFCS